MKKVELQNVEPVDVADLANPERPIAPSPSTKEIDRRRARQRRATLARRITRKAS